jgi:hypothetical protein
MFSKNSRYRNLPESSPVDARGERPRGKWLRVIPRPAGRFLYTVRDADRLDLIAFKFYGDPTKWWQICDANPEPPFPLDLLDTRPFVTERFALWHPSFDARFKGLLTDLKAFGMVTAPDPGDESNPSRRSPGRSLLVVKYPASLVTRGQIVAALAARGFDFLGADGWPAADGETLGAFAFDYPAAKSGWAAMVEALAETSGVVRVESDFMEGALELTYNGTVIPRPALVSIIRGHGFELTREPETLSRVGARIVLPPDQPV